MFYRSRISVEYVFVQDSIIYQIKKVVDLAVLMNIQCGTELCKCPLHSRLFMNCSKLRDKLKKLFMVYEGQFIVDNIKIEK